MYAASSPITGRHRASSRELLTRVVELDRVNVRWSALLIPFATASTSASDDGFFQSWKSLPLIQTMFGNFA